MHYCWLLYTSKKPTKEKIEQILNPYKFENSTQNYLGWDFYLVGGRYCGLLKAKTPEPDVDGGYFTNTISSFYETLTYGKDEAINKMIYQISPNPQAKNKYFEVLWSSYCYFGWREGHMRCDGAPVETIMNDLEDTGFGFIAEDGSVSHRYEDISSYSTKCLEIGEKYKNGYVTIIDLHI